MLRRIREDKTNYRKRKAVLIGRHNFAAVRVSNRNVQIQVLRPSKRGDEVLVSAHSRELIKYGWHGSRKNLPACYLTGLLVGAKATMKNVNACILYTGNRFFSSKIAASVKGLLDAGMKIPVEEKALPIEDRLNGKHIVDYAKDLKDNDELYTTRFSALIKEGFVPESYTENVERTKSSILGKSFAKNEVKIGTEAKPKEVTADKEPKAKATRKRTKGKTSKKESKN